MLHCGLLTSLCHSAEAHNDVVGMGGTAASCRLRRHRTPSKDARWGRAVGFEVMPSLGAAQGLPSTVFADNLILENLENCSRLEFLKKEACPIEPRLLRCA